MAATAEQQQLTEILLDQISETDFPSETQLDRIERLISTRADLETYIAVLTKKLQGKMFPDRRLLDRLEQLLSLMRRIDQEAG